MFQALLQFPIPTTNLTDEIYTALEKIFDGRNPIYKIDFSSTKYLQDWLQYRKEVLHEPSVWKTRGFEMMKTAINSIVVVDLPEEQKGERPEPYFYFLDIRKLIAGDNKSGKVFEWIIFEDRKNRVAVFDDINYRVFERIEGSTEIQAEPIIDIPHNLGYCPARFFWTTPVNYQKPILKRAPLSNNLGKLDLLLFFDVSNEHLNLYGRFPIYSSFAQDCDYNNTETGNYCKDGFLRTSDGLYLSDRIGPVRCPVCDSKRLDGAGSHVEIDPPNIDNGNADLRNPVQITSPDVVSLEYNGTDLEKRKNEIYTSVTGNKGDTINSQAINEPQVLSILQSMESALKTPQSNFEQIMEWTTKTICLLRYGEPAFRQVSISLGTEHYVMTTEVILSLYDKAKKAAFSVSTLDLLEDLYHETEFKNNPEQLQRQKILNNLDPFRHRSILDVKAMYDAGQIKYEDYLLKSNFSSLIMRFERENISILEFAENASFSEKINLIKSSLVIYANEMKPMETIKPETNVFINS